MQADTPQHDAATVTRAEVCIAACADAWRGDGEILASPMLTIPVIAARTARATFEPDLLLSDGESRLIAGTWAVDEEPAADQVEGYVPFRTIFDIMWSGKRHVMMGPIQVDRFGNANISAIGDFARPKIQLLGVRGAPGNTANHATSYWVPKHSARTFVDRSDMVSGVGYDRARAVGGDVGAMSTSVGWSRTWPSSTSRGPDRSMRLASVHPGVSVDEVVAAHRLRTGHRRATCPPPGCRPSDELRVITRAGRPAGAAREGGAA